MYRFPPRLIERLRRASSKLEAYTSKMKSADHRYPKLPGSVTVHEINLSRQTRQKFVIKKVHNGMYRNWSAEATLHNIHLRLAEYRSTNGEVMRRHAFNISVVPAEVIGENLLLMPRIRAPTVMELVNRKYAKQKDASGNKASRYENNINEIEWIGNHIMHHLHVDNLGDIFYLGQNKNKQHQFMLTVDTLFRDS